MPPKTKAGLVSVERSRLMDPQIQHQMQFDFLGTFAFVGAFIQKGHPKLNSQMMKSLILVLSGIALEWPSHALEAKLMTDEEVFQGIDADSSGFLSLEEYKNAMFQNNYAKLFQRIDKDGDGKVSIAEFKKERFLTAEESFRRLDADGSGLLSKEEFVQNSRDPEALAKTFQSLDSDGDGKVSFEEFKKPAGKGKKKK
ncbi:MAG: EF-hand domain-containing protein [Prosthecobacter sp.]